MPNKTIEVGRGNAETLDASWLNIGVNWGSVGLIWTSWLTVAKVCCMRIRFSVKGTDRVKEETGKKRGQETDVVRVRQEIVTVEGKRGRWGL